MKKSFLIISLTFLYLSIGLIAWSDTPLYISENRMGWSRGDNGSTYQEWSMAPIPYFINPVYYENGQLGNAYFYPPDNYSINPNGMPLIWIYSVGGDFPYDPVGIEFTNGVVVNETVSTWPFPALPDPYGSLTSVWIEIGYGVFEGDMAHFFPDVPITKIVS